ncbi:hypothetical protein SYNPS1DRAFT_27144 [Syncephalis pseudoplumigaleata]|uniref:Uncharacterized protein n=1 Tax=Syncephalis pseudoplumigaleata TaxID=1712513 RepID=A0A4P9Z3Z1_9FUNG|nr:hypothetical protein SYNPS1DRAFT_27144 [Syncephalis pseudoplumigaleata]|eukprot:RKP27196.1 hypothetical protein SYNPS1DRAFT_27144 [Syncephalis pseudoplumigaleata]
MPRLAAFTLFKRSRRQQQPGQAAPPSPSSSLQSPRSNHANGNSAWGISIAADTLCSIATSNHLPDSIAMEQGVLPAYDCNVWPDTDMAGHAFTSRPGSSASSATTSSGSSSSSRSLEDEGERYNQEGIDCKAASSPRCSSPRSLSRGRRLLHKASCGLLQRLSTESTTTSASTAVSSDEHAAKTSSSSSLPLKLTRQQSRFYSLPGKHFRFIASRRNTTASDAGADRRPRKSKSLNNLESASAGLDGRRSTAARTGTGDASLPDTKQYRWSRLRETVFLYDPALMPSSSSRQSSCGNAMDDADLFDHEFVPNTSSSPYITY